MAAVEHGGNDNSLDSRPWVAIEYRFNRADDSEYFNVDGPMENILPGADSNCQIMQSLEEQRLSYFFRYLDYFMNYLEG